MTADVQEKLYEDKSRPRIVLDANVLASAVRRDIILRFAKFGLVDVHWSPLILEETYRALLTIRKKTGENDEQSQIKSKRVIEKIKEQFPLSSAAPSDSKTIPQIELPDPDDTHVVETAIHVKARYIVTENLRDFPNENLGDLFLTPRLEAICADEMIHNTLEEKTSDGIEIVRDVREKLRRPPMDVETLLYNWKNRHNLHKTVEFLQQYKDQI